MSLIHDRLYSTGNYEQIDFGDYLREMLALIVSSNRTDGTDVDVDLQAMALWVPVERAVPLSLIASELVLNALKHGCRGRPRGEIAVRLTMRGTDCELFVGDDGPGMDPAAADGRGVGMQLIDSLTRQIRGSYEVQGSPPGWGVSVRWREA
jgi:two-component sensor histidine kinase